MAKTMAPLTSIERPANTDADRLAAATTANNLAEAKFAPPLTPKTGAIESAGQLVSMAILLEPKAYDKIAKLIEVPAGLTPKNIVVTNRKELGVLISAAEDVNRQIEQLIAEGNRIQDKDKLQQLSFITVGTALAVAGAVEGLVGVFRTNYAVSSSELEASDLQLELAIIRNSKAGTIDGVDLYADPDSAFLKRIESLAGLRNSIARNLADDREAKKFVAASDTVTSALLKPAENGVSPAAHIASLISTGDKIRNGGAVLYVSVVKPTGTVVTTQKYFRRNGIAHVYFTGLVTAVFEVPNTGLQKPMTFTIGESASIDLAKLHKSAVDNLSVQTGLVH
jgi:hypothetical protein